MDLGTFDKQSFALFVQHDLAEVYGRLHQIALHRLWPKNVACEEQSVVSVARPDHANSLRQTSQDPGTRKGQLALQRCILLLFVQSKTGALLGKEVSNSERKQRILTFFISGFTSGGVALRFL